MITLIVIILLITLVHVISIIIHKNKMKERETKINKAKNIQVKHTFKKQKTIISIVSVNSTYQALAPPHGIVKSYATTEERKNHMFFVVSLWRKNHKELQINS